MRRKIFLKDWHHVIRGEKKKRPASPRLSLWQRKNQRSDFITPIPSRSGRQVIKSSEEGPGPGSHSHFRRVRRV